MSAALTIAGFTGTRLGMTDLQTILVDQLLKTALEAHFGDCKGADTEAYWMASEHGAKLIGHPPLKGGLRSWLRYDEEREPKDYHARDRDIVDESEYLIGAPGGPPSGNKGGTWYTIRYAKGKVPIWLAMPDGELRIYDAKGKRIL